jgi:hypothetical protein
VPAQLTAGPVCHLVRVRPWAARQLLRSEAGCRIDRHRGLLLRRTALQGARMGDPMFLLNNIHDRPYSRIYPQIKEVVFDISENQLKNVKNSDWHKITKGSIVCIVNSSRKISTFYLIEANTKTDVVDESGNQHVITGVVIAKLQEDKGMTALLNEYRVKHAYLPGNKFSVGFNVADLGDALDALALKTKKGNTTLGELKRDA